MGERNTAFGWTRVRWTEARKEQFLAALSQDCNVRRATEVAGVRPENVYLLRRKDADFCAAWGVALELGYQLLETRLVARAGEPASEPDLDVELAIRLLTRHGNAMAGKASRTGKAPMRATREETDAAILKKIDAIEKARDAGLA